VAPCQLGDDLGNKPVRAAMEAVAGSTRRRCCQVPFAHGQRRLKSRWRPIGRAGVRSARRRSTPPVSVDYNEPQTAVAPAVLAKQGFETAWPTRNVAACRSSKPATSPIGRGGRRRWAAEVLPLVDDGNDIVALTAPAALMPEVRSGR